ncbi:alpha-D-ribose 1-methylphosphonate 5-triphosphate synthase subunit PhnH [Pseudorhizobium tarimense]|uniref:Alpha-D-ribose 1-methylphosphonate 5-triphosphate synthase subunit PhnH n=1 Tax=Pseudorhizobium tarimense TaxID=1079109 RepID=A0ABV2H1V8_9HYPH|nr:phosphonate C-P lyase system protein PhnH [Pseudorhizobium tarimense]MCJ8517871.1 phosphonate C-P lyase system protein PhnH [Pseudorhizobium tarimense]
MSMSARALSGGFSQPVFDAQAVFRLMMEGMSRPGTIQTVNADVGQPSPLGRAAGAVALALCDADTPVWLHSSYASSAVARWIAFHTGATTTSEKAEARFALMQAAVGVCSFDLFASGTQEYPDRSTTIIIEVEAIGEGRPLALSGPGIKEQVMVNIQGLPGIFDGSWKSNGALFPRGVDVVLTAGSRLLCLPRTTKLA